MHWLCIGRGLGPFDKHAFKRKHILDLRAMQVFLIN